VDKVCLLKPNVVDGILAIDSCHPSDNVCIGRATFEPPFLFVYSCFFSKLHVAFPSMSLPWVSFGCSTLLPLSFIPNHGLPFKPFGLFVTCCLRPSSETFLHYYTSHLTDPVSWLSLISWSRNVLFAPYTTSYTKFKGKFFKIFVESKDVEYFVNQNG